jgi:hypothetical protein
MRTGSRLKADHDEVRELAEAVVDIERHLSAVTHKLYRLQRVVVATVAWIVLVEVLRWVV